MNLHKVDSVVMFYGVKTFTLILPDHQLQIKKCYTIGQFSTSLLLCKNKLESFCLASFFGTFGKESILQIRKL